MEQYGGTIRWVFEADTTQFNQEFDNVSDKAVELREITQSTAKATTQAAEETAQAVSRQGSATAQLFGSLGTALKGIGVGTFTTAATAATGALSKLMSKGIQATNFLEVSQTAMSGLLGSMEKGNQAMSIAAEFWSKNPFQRDVITRATQQLVQYGRQLGDLEKDLYRLKPIAMTSSASMDELATLYGRAAAAGRVMTQDIEVLSYRGVPIYRELAKQLKTTEAGVRDFASQGKISFEIFQKALEGAVSQEALDSFENTLDRAKDKLGGSISTLAGYIGGYEIINNKLEISANGLYRSWVKLLRTLAGSGDANNGLGSGLRTKELQTGLQKIGEAISKLVNMITSLVEPAFQTLGKLVGFIGDNTQLLVPIFGGLLVVYGQLAARIPIVNQLFGKWSSSITGVSKALKGLMADKPILAAFIAIFAVGFVSALKNSEEFRNSLKKIFDSIGKIVGTVLPIFQQLLEIIMQVIASPAVISIFEALAGAVAGLAEAIASLPVEVIQFLTGAILGLIVVNKLNPFTSIALGVMTLIAAFSKLVNAIGGIQNLPKKIAEFFEGLPQKMLEIGGNIIAGFTQGISQGIGWVAQAAKNVALSFLNTFKAMLGIHSPSKVMEQQGEYIGLGLAEGITNSTSVVQRAMENLAKATLSEAEAVVKNKLDFNVIDVNGQYKEFKKIAKLFKEGSAQYEEAIAKMEDARKSVNLQIIKLQDEYNSALDESIQKVKNFYSLFSSVSQKGGTDSSGILKNLDQQLASLQGWSEAQNIISNLDLDENLKKELQAMGADSANELQAIANMTSSELDTLNTLYKQKQELANNSATKLMEGLKDSTLDQIEKLRDGIDGETIEVKDVGGRLVSEIGEGITGAIPTLESAYAKLGKYMEEAQRSLAKSGSAAAGSTGKVADPETTIANTMGKVEESIKKAMGDMGKSLVPVGIGLIVAPFLVKAGSFILGKVKDFLGGKLAQALSKSSLGAKSGLLGNLLGGGKNGADKLGNLSETVSQSKTISKSTKTINKNIGDTGQSFQKVNGILNVIIKGAAAVAAVAGAIAAMALALRVTYEALKGVDWLELAGDLTGMAVVMGVMSAICGVVGKFAKYVALGAIVEAVVAGVITLSAILLAKASEYAKLIDHESLFQMEGVLTLTSVILGIIGAFAKFVALGAIVEAVVSGALLLCAFLLKQAGDIAAGINSGAIFAMEGTLAGVNAILIALGALAIPATLGVIIEDVFSGGLLVLAALLKNASDLAAGIDENNLKNLTKCLDTAIAGINKVGLLSSIVGTVKTIIDDLFSGAFMILANNLREASDKGSGISEEGIDNVVKAISTIADLGAGDLLKNLANIVNSGTLIPVSSSVRDIANNLADIKSDNLDEEAIKKIKRIVEDFSTINISGSGLFENKGDKAREVASIAESAKNIARNFADFPDDNYEGKVKNFVTALAAFQDITPAVRKGITDFRSLGDSLGNIDWIKRIFGDVPEDIHSRAERLVDSIKLFDRIDEKARIGARHINAMGDSLSNIDWIKRIFGDVPEDIWSKAERLVNAIKLFDRIDENARNGALRFNEMHDSLGNIDWVKHIFSDIPEDIEAKAEGLVNAIKKIASLQLAKEDLGDLSTIALFIQAVVNKINSSADQLRNGGSSVIEYIKQGMAGANDKAQSAGADLVLQVALGIGKNLDKLKTAGSETQGAFWNGIQAKMSDEYHQGAALAGEVVKGIGSKNQDMYKSGGYAVEGFARGISDKNWMLTSTGIRLAETFLKAFKKRAGEGSPWKTTFQSGQFAAEGLINGLTSMEGEIVSEADLIADSIVEALDLSDTTLTPSVSFGGTMAPAMDVGYGGYGGGRGSVIIEQTNNNYTEYDIEQVNRDLSWELSKV